jgi:uncharacterized coiled-coil protein SlyX
MKQTIIILSVSLFLISTFCIGLVWYSGNRLELLEAQISSKSTQISTLNDTLTKTSNENVILKSQANLKSFTTLKELQRFLKDAKAPKEVDSNTYASETCIALMREAKEKGYWLGITAVNTTDENYWKAYVRDRKGATDIKWHIFNLAIVGDSDIYLVDSQNIEDIYFIVSVTGDFAEYNKVSESNVSNLNVH